MGNPAKEMAEEVLAGSGLSAAKLGLRFDRVVVRVLGDLSAVAEAAVPNGSAVVVTITAPIKLPAKTVEAVGDKMAAADRAGNQTGDIYGNQISLRWVREAADQRPKLVGFVHNPSTDAGELLDLAERWLAQ